MKNRRGYKTKRCLFSCTTIFWILNGVVLTKIYFHKNVRTFWLLWEHCFFCSHECNWIEKDVTGEYLRCSKPALSLCTTMLQKFSITTLNKKYFGMRMICCFKPSSQPLNLTWHQSISTLITIFKINRYFYQ